MDTTKPSSNTQSLDVESILRDIDVSGKALSHDQDGARRALITKARSLIAALETPSEAIIWMAWAEVRAGNSLIRMIWLNRIVYASAYKTGCSADCYQPGRLRLSG